MKIKFIELHPKEKNHFFFFISSHNNYINHKFSIELQISLKVVKDII